MTQNEMVMNMTNSKIFIDDSSQMVTSGKTIQTQTAQVLDLMQNFMKMWQKVLTKEGITTSQEESA